MHRFGADDAVEFRQQSFLDPLVEEGDIKEAGRS
jgi:hypothetical protein